MKKGRFFELLVDFILKNNSNLYNGPDWEQTRRLAFLSDKIAISNAIQPIPDPQKRTITMYPPQNNHNLRIWSFICLQKYSVVQSFPMQIHFQTKIVSSNRQQRLLFGWTVLLPHLWRTEYSNGSRRVFSQEVQRKVFLTGLDLEHTGRYP